LEQLQIELSFVKDKDSTDSEEDSFALMDFTGDGRPVASL
jgi:hypothetical protein